MFVIAPETFHAGTGAELDSKLSTNLFHVKRTYTITKNGELDDEDARGGSTGIN